MPVVREEVTSATLYHRQNSVMACGWACAQIVINSELNPDLGNQDALSDLRSPNWWTDPDELAMRLTSIIHKNFKRFCTNGEEQISRRIVATIHNSPTHNGSFGIAPCALVWGDAHWVVVYGFEIDKTFSGYLSPSDKTYKIVAFYAHDPSPSRPYGLPPWVNVVDPHDSIGTICGTGGQLGRAHIRVNYHQWTGRWMTGVKAINGWIGKFVAVARANTGIACTDASWPPGLPPAAPAITPPATRPPADYDTAKIEAVNALKNEVLNQVPIPFPWDRLGVQPLATWAQWVTPNVTGVAGFYYWLVEVQATGSASKPVAVILDPDYKMLETAAIPAGDNVLGRYEELFAASPVPDIPTLITTLLRSRTVEFRAPKDPGDVPTFPVPEDILETLRTVWQHDLHSETPYAPYYRITIGGRHIYFRIDDPTFFKYIQSTPDPINMYPYTGLYKGEEEK